MTWLDADPPTWRWAHDPDFRSLRQRKIIQGFIKATEDFIASSSRPDVSVVEFYSGGVLLSGS